MVWAPFQVTGGGNPYVSGFFLFPPLTMLIIRIRYGPTDGTVSFPLRTENVSLFPTNRGLRLKASLEKWV